MDCRHKSPVPIDLLRNKQTLYLEINSEWQRLELQIFYAIYDTDTPVLEVKQLKS